MRFSSSSLVAALVSSSYAQTYKNATNSYILSSDYLDLGDWQEAYTKAKAFVSGLTTAQKLSIITGGSFNGTNGTAGWTALLLKDGMESIQGTFYVSTFSQSSALAMTWDKDAIYAQAKAVGTEYYLMGVDIIDGPTSQPLGRSPWGGRQGETFGVDSYLNAVVMGLAVQGTTDAGIIAGGKHYILNEQETNRQGGGGMGGGGGGFGMSPGSSSSSNSTATGSTPTGTAMASGSSIPSGTASAGGSAPTGSSSNSTTSTTTTSSDSYSSNADDKTLHETYLFPFYNGVKAGLGTIMCAMNRVNSTYSCENSVLLQKLLKTELGFPGYVNPDVSSQKTALGSANGGLDQGSSSTWSESTIATLLSNGSLTQERFDDMAIRNAVAYFKAGMDDGKQPAYDATSGNLRNVRGNHSALIRENGGKSLVLLKNNGVLPLKAPNTMAIFGSHAGPVVGGPNYGFSVQGSGPIYEGHLATGSGSGQGSLGYVIDPHMAIVPRAAADGTFVRWILNNTYSAASSQGSLGNLLGSSSTALDASYASYAANTEVCICFINALQGEGADRTELRNTVQDDMVLSVAAECNNTVVVVQTVGPRLLDSWIENENITAVLYSSLLGQESGNSIADVLYGDVNPSGRLAYTIAKNESDYNCVVEKTNLQINYTEGNYIDYKYFDKYNVTPRYAFGHGLSYTTFNYSSLTVSPSSSTTNISTYPTGVPSVGGNSDLWTVLYNVSITISNTGSVDGAEVPQLYISFPDEADKPVRELRGFERVVITKGGEKEVSFPLMRRDLSYWDVVAQQWALAKGTYTLSVGASSRDLRSTGSLVVA